MAIQTKVASGVLTSKGFKAKVVDPANDKAKVCISMITRGWVRIETSTWILRTVAQLAPDVEFRYVVGFPVVDHMRNVQVKQFLESDCTHLFILDSDCVPQPETIQKLLEFDLPIVASPYFNLIESKIVSLVKDRDEGYTEHKPVYKKHNLLTGLQKCDAVGTSGLLIKREVFETISPPYFKFQYDDDGLVSCSEDYYFCNKAKANGYEIYAYCDLVQTHIKEVDLGGLHEVLPG